MLHKNNIIDYILSKINLLPKKLNYKKFYNANNADKKKVQKVP